MSGKIKKLCQDYTNLTEEDIEILENLNTFLPLLSETHGGDVFIDCKTWDSNAAIVVAEALKPGTSYQETVIGKLAYRENEPAALRTLSTGVRTLRLAGVSQENNPILQTTTAIRNQGKIIGVLIIENDVSEEFIEKNKLIENQMYENPKTSSFIPIVSDYVVDSLLIFNKEGTLQYANNSAKTFYRFLGYKEDLEGMNFINLALEDISFERILQEKYLETKELFIGENCYNIKYSLFQGDQRLIMIIRDQTQLMRQKKALISKSVAIQEIHHRVKNNLQTIASLLRMQSRRNQNPQLNIAFQESINRILSIATTHEILAKDLDGHILITDLIKKVLSNTIYTGQNEMRVKEVQVYGDPTYIDADKGTTLALVINELVSNAYEHAFKPGDQGVINIQVKRDVFKNHIIVEDNGCGFNPEEENSNSFGLNIVKGLIQETLQGDVHFSSSEEGTQIKLSFINRA
ncbi:signal transduction histidine kinase [Peptoniphilus sp. oral taxon 375 str. F0436]|nr:signal transduction histidine kinase [Peptoniphilus sp. oral taxon 375 str. F0436]